MLTTVLVQGGKSGKELAHEPHFASGALCVIPNCGCRRLYASDKCGNHAVDESLPRDAYDYWRPWRELVVERLESETEIVRGCFRESLLHALPTQFVKKRFRECDFVKFAALKVVFSDSVFDACDLVGATFTECKFVQARFIGCFLGYMRFHSCDLSNAVFTCHTFQDIAFNDDCRFRNALVTNSTFQNVNLSGKADLTGARLEGSTFVDCNLAGVDLRQARLQGVTFHGDCNVSELKVTDEQFQDIQWEIDDDRRAEVQVFEESGDIPKVGGTDRDARDCAADKASVALNSAISPRVLEPILWRERLWASELGVKRLGRAVGNSAVLSLMLGIGGAALVTAYAPQSGVVIPTSTIAATTFALLVACIGTSGLLERRAADGSAVDACRPPSPT